MTLPVARSQVRPHGPSIDTWLIQVVVIAAAFELIVLRVATRTAIHIPGISRIETPYRTTAEIGRLAYYVSVVLIVTMLIVVLWRRVTTGGRWLSGLAIGWFLVVAGSTRLGLTADSTLAWSVVGSVGILLPAAIRRFERRMLPVLLFGVSFVVAGVHSATQAGGLATSVLGPAPDGLLPLAEGLALLSCVLSPMLVGARVRRGPVVAGVGVALVTFIALLVSPATIKIILLWNFGLAGHFPTVLYGLAFGALVFTVLSARTTDPHLAFGLALIAIGGLGLHNSYQSGLVILGLATLGNVGPIQVPDPPGPGLRTLVGVRDA